MEKNEVESVLSVEQKEFENVEKTTDLVDMERVSSEENIEIAEDTIANSEDLSIEVDSSEETTVLSVDSEDSQVKVSEEMDNSFGDDDNATGQDVDKKTDVKKVQVAKDDTENYTDIDVDSAINDSKLSFTSDVAYVEQLNKYKKYINQKTNKKVNIYLYSVLKNQLVSLEENNDENS